MNTISEIKRKMDTENPIFVTIATDELMNIIKSKVKGTRTDMTNIPEMLLLQEYCCHQNPIICTTTFQALCKFMTTDNHQSQLLIDWLIVISTQIKNKIGLIQEIFELINFQLKNSKIINFEYINTLIDLLIKIMDDNLDIWPVILFHLKVNTNFDDHEFIKNWLTITKRLFKFIFLSQTPSTYRTSFVNLFVQIIGCASDYDLIFEIYSWLQANNLDDCLFLHNFLEECWDKVPGTQHEIQFNLCLCIFQTSVQLISYGYDPTCMLQHLNSILIFCPCASEIALLCVSRTLSFCSSKFVLKILNFCSKVVQNFGCHKIITQSIIASILQWNRTKVINSDTVNLFFPSNNSDLNSSRSCIQNHVLFQFLTSDSFLLTSYSFSNLCREFNDEQLISKWLSEIHQTNYLSNDIQFNVYLVGLYLCKIGDRSQKQSILKLLNKTFLLPLISYAIDIKSSHYNRLDLIKAIPTAACLQENISLVISLIKRFENSKEEALNILSIDMYYDLWMTEVRCYRFLLYCLSKDVPGWQWNVVKLWTVKKMVKSNPNSDLVAVLKQMFRFYIQQSMYLPIQLALESLVDLCLTEYINPEALIKMIDSNVSDIHHTSVISSYCNLLATLANQTTEDSKRLECFKKLWSMVLHPNDLTVTCALKALSDINYESLPLCVLPKQFQSSSKIVTQLEDLENDLTNGPIPAECWVKFLQNINKSFINNAQLMLSVWLRQELEKNVISRTPSDHEPKSLKHLPDHSIARGLMTFIVPKRKKMIDSDNDIKLACLAVINNADKPMYSFDWSFLDKYITEGPSCKLWKESVILVAKQSTRSTTAFRLLHKCYDHHLNFNNDDLKLLFTVLFKVSNIIYHNLQKQFVTDIVNDTLNKIFYDSYSTNSNKYVNLLCHILFECKRILQSPETHMDNFNFICNILENVWCAIHLQNKEILLAFLDCCLAMPLEVLNNLKPYPIQESMISKFVTLSCVQNFIHSSISFDAFNECIQVCNQFAKKTDILYTLITEVFKLETFVSYHHEFIFNFMIYLASFTKKTNSFPNGSFKIQCSIFINLIVTLSGYSSLRSIKDKKLNDLVFPLALATFAMDTSQSPRVIEWLKTMRTIQNLPKEYSTLFYCCLTAFKNDKCLLQWTNKKQIILQ